MLNILPGLVDCKDCELYEHGFVVPGRGAITAPVMFIGEAPGREENNVGVPFIGAAGKLLAELISLAGLDLENCYLTNVVKHWPGLGNPTPKITYVRACKHWLEQEIDIIQPYMIVLLGKTAIAAVAPDLKLALMHGQKMTRNVRGRECIVVPMYHPAAGLHQRSLVPVIKNDFRHLGQEGLRSPDIKVIREDYIQTFDMASPVAVDLETTGLDPSCDRIVAASWAWSGNEGHVTYNIDGFLEQLRGHTGTVIFHNAQFDRSFLARRGLTIPPERLWDTMLSGYVLGKVPLSLKGRSMVELGYNMETFESLAGELPKDASLIEEERLTPYAAADAAVTYQHYQRDIAEVVSNGASEILDIQHRLIPVLDAMRTRGILVDVERLGLLKNIVAEEEEEAKQAVWSMVGQEFNVRSTLQLRKVLFEDLGLRPTKRTKGRVHWSTDNDSLKALIGSHPCIEAITRYRELTKMRGTYIDPIERHIGGDGRVHPTWKQIGTVSGRLSCENPNAQNQPYRNEVWRKRVRGLYVAKPGSQLLSVDYSQIELRVAAALSRDPVLAGIYERGESLHLYTLHNILNQPGADSHHKYYTIAKNVNFGMIYRLSDLGLQRYLRNQAGVLVSLTEAHDIRANFLGRFSRLMEWEEEVVEHLLTTGWVETLMHHRRYFPELDMDDPEETIKSAINHPVQGTAGGDVMRSAMVRLSNMPIIINNHDELLFEIPERDIVGAKDEICGIMISVAESLLNFPVEVDYAIVDDWGEVG